MQCEATTSEGQPCKRDALADGTVCASHAGRCGAPFGNRNALRHGLYSRLLTPEEQFDLLTASAADGLDDEIGMTRLLILRALRDQEAPPEVYTRLVESLCRQLRLRRALSGKGSDELAESLARVLSEVAAELGLDR
jgi:hypothetical protein